MILDCGHEVSSHTEHTTGYGTDSNGKTHCYECCAKQDMDYMQKNGRIALYLVQKDNQYEITNWPGSLRFKAYSVTTGRHNIAGKRYDVWFMVNGVRWHGIQYGEFNQICHCRKTKETKK